MKKMNKKGFTLMEMLIVVAIIAVLIAIAIPVFTAQLERSREAVDAANLRSAYAEVSAEALLGDPSATRTVEQKQTEGGWSDGDPDFPENFNVDAPKDGSGTWTVSWDDGDVIADNS